MPVMIDPKTGETFNNVPDGEVQRATDQFGLVSAEHYAQLQKYGGIADQTAAAAKTAANVATFGLAGFDSAEDKAQIDTFKEKSPTLHALTEIAGAAAPGALGGGAASLGMRALGTSARAAQIGGLVAEEVGQAAALETQHATEEDRGIDLGNIVMGIPLALGVSAAGRLARGASRRIRGLPDGTPAPGVLDMAESEGNVLAQGRRTSEARRSVGAAGAGPDKRAPLTDQEVRTYARSRAEIHSQVERFGGDAIEDSAAGTAPAFDEVHNISLKKSDLAGRMDDADPELMAEFAERHTDALGTLVKELEAKGQKSAARQLQANLDEVISTMDDPVEQFIAADRSKRTLDRLRTRYGAAARRDIQAEGVVDALDEVVNPLRADLEDASTWGKFAAEKQAGENVLWSGDEGIIRSGSIWQNEFLEKLPGAAGRMRKGLHEVPVFKVKGDIVQHAINMKPRDFELTMNAMNSWIDKVEQMSLLKTELGAASVGNTPVLRLQQGLNDMRTLRDELYTLREVETRGGDVIKKEAARAASQSLGELAFDAAESVVPGVKVVDSAAEKLTGKSIRDALFAPKIKAPTPELTREAAGATIRERRGGLGKPSERARPRAPVGAGVSPVGSLASQLATLGQAGSRAAQGVAAFERAATPVTDSLADISDHSRAIQERAALGLISKESRPPKLPPLTTRFKEGAPNLDTAFQNKADDLRKASEDPQAFVDGMVDTFGTMAEGGHEELYSKVVARVQIGTQYLLANMPPSVGISMVRPDGIPPDIIAVMKFAAMWSGVFSPGDVVYDVATGDATPTQIKTLREVHPDIYGSLRAEVLKQVAQAGQKIPFETLRTLDNLFDLPGVAGPAFGPSMTATMASAYAQPGSKSPKQSLGGESVIAPPSANQKFGTGPSTIA